MTDADMIRAPVPRAQYPQQSQNQIRPNVNPNQGQPIRPPPQAQFDNRQAPNSGQRPPVAPSPIRRVDSRGSIQVNQFVNQNQQRPAGQVPSPLSRQSSQQNIQPGFQPGSPQQTVRPQQQFQGQPQQFQPQQPIQNRPFFGNQQPNQQIRQPYPRPPIPQQQQQQQPGGQVNPNQFRPQYPQTQQPRPNYPVPPLAKTAPNQGINQSQGQLSKQSSFERLRVGQDPKMASEIAKTNMSQNNFLNNDDDDDVVLGPASTPLKMAKPIDPMTQSQYGFLDNRSTIAAQNSPKISAQNEENGKRIMQSSFYGTPIEDMNKAMSPQIQSSPENRNHQDIKNTTLTTQDLQNSKSNSPTSPAMPAPVDPRKVQENSPNTNSGDRREFERTESRSSLTGSGSASGPRKSPIDQVDRVDIKNDKMHVPSPKKDAQPNAAPVSLNTIINTESPAKQPPIIPRSPANFNKDNQNTPKKFEGNSERSYDSPKKEIIKTENIVNGTAKEPIKSAEKKESQENIQNLQKSKPNNIPTSKKGDNDSGVDESTQGNERNGTASPGSPLKSPTKIPGISRPPSTTPSNKSRSASRSRNTKTPEPESVKKVPMNKIQVGSAPSPNLKAVRSKIGSLDNATYKPGGGNVKIESKKIEIKAAPRIEAKNDKYTPRGGDKKIISTKLQWTAKSKIGSLENANHKPGGGDKKIETIKQDFKEKAKPKVGSKDNVKHVPKGGEIKAVEEQTQPDIQNHKLDIKAQSKIGSLDNVKHKPGGGDKKIFDDKEYLKNVDHPIAPSPPSQSSIPASLTTSTGADENLNQQQS